MAGDAEMNFALNEKESQALTLAMKVHEGQVDKAGLPYILHPIRVAFAMHQPGTTENAFIAAILHDAVEDTNLSLDEIEEKFGKVARDTVDHLSRRKGETYMGFIYRCASSPLASRIKLADIADNTRPERLSCLPEGERSISIRYRKARQYLEANL
jgi:hypothetical protein